MRRLSLSSELILSARKGKTVASGDNYENDSRDIKAAAAEAVADPIKWREVARIGANPSTSFAASSEAVDQIRNYILRNGLDKKGMDEYSKAPFEALKEIAIHGQAWQWALDTASDVRNKKLVKEVSEYKPKQGPYKNDREEREAKRDIQIAEYAKKLLPNFKKVKKAD
ncbi:Uncharacterised protein [uncultured archaeon]|nr:Uncharacterised protein [uncultured archaeon]